MMNRMKILCFMALTKHGCDQKQVARTEQEILNRIREKESRVTHLKKKLEGVKVGHLVFSM